MTEHPIPLVLIVESDAIQRDMLQVSLTRLGCEVISSHQPEQILDLCVKQHPSLLVLDTFIPGSNGMEILLQLKNKRFLRHIRILVISSFGFPEIIQQYKDMGVHEFLIKPIDLDDFTQRAMYLLQT